MAKAKTVAVRPIVYGYLDGDKNAVEVSYRPGEEIDTELFDEAALERLRKKGAIGTKRDLEAAEAAPANDGQSVLEIEAQKAAAAASPPTKKGKK